MARKLAVYIAASWQNRFRLRDVRQRLAELGVKVTSRWIDFDREYCDGDFQLEARRDYADIDKASCLIIDTTDEASRGGREWEAGYATGRGIRVIRVGPVITPFHAAVKLAFPDWNRLLAHFATAIEHGDR